MKALTLGIISSVFLAGCQADKPYQPQKVELPRIDKPLITKVQEKPINNKTEKEEKVTPILEMTQKTFTEIVKNKPKFDKFTSPSERKRLTESYLDGLNESVYELDIKLEKYNNQKGYYLISKTFLFKVLHEGSYIATNAYGAKVNVDKTHYRHHGISFNKGYLRVTGDEARSIDGKVGTLRFKNLSPSHSYGGELCGTSTSGDASFSAPFEIITEGCQIKAEVISFSVDGKKFSLSSSI